MQVTIRFGLANELTKDVPEGTSVGTLIHDRSIASALGYGSNVQAVVDGVVQSDNSPLSDGDVVTIETKANSKA